MDAFRRVFKDGCLTDLGWRGSKFTWYNGHENESIIIERLDRAIANHC